ncbi:MAG: twin-arginine translocase subunit TatC [Cyanobacteria bacterium HKST-UBA03]|nr:twin-arginine translocase subunit TatC [Cyanobacteria bacterium HKST-UBA03]
MTPLDDDPLTPQTLIEGLPFGDMAEHLDELRGRLIWCVGVWFVVTMLCFALSPQALNWMKLLAPAQTAFIQITPGEAFMASFKFSLFAALGLVLPFWLYHLLRFVSPGLTQKERRVMMPLATGGLALFTLGVAFGYWVVLPQMLTFLIGFGSNLAQTQLSIGAFLGFCTPFLFTSGLIFQLPLLLLGAAWFRLISSQQLIAQWKYSIVAVLILGAIITPSGDPFSQVVMALALYGLYGISIVLIKLVGR